MWNTYISCRLRNVVRTCVPRIRRRQQRRQCRFETHNTIKIIIMIIIWCSVARLRMTVPARTDLYYDDLNRRLGGFAWFEYCSLFLNWNIIALPHPVLLSCSLSCECKYNYAYQEVHWLGIVGRDVKKSC